MSDAPRGLARQAIASTPETTKYHTFWPRLWALVLDALIVLPAISLGEYLMRPERGLSSVISGLALTSVLPVLYRTLMHARFGQTIGKMVARVKILDASESKGPSFGQCLLRDLPEYLVTTLTAYHVIELCRGGIYQPEQPDRSTFAQALDLSYITWWFAEAMVLSANFRRRALHDWLAGTVVVKCPPKRKSLALKV
ncbi:RDD family protein [Verrucomicrobium sp. BvORR106]|uniref:RDD family protein n=1 Tax=Verrucomicrobium sp. BvORR106 TaxID=1403819 RepID=UPI00056F1DCF|nr:RDD family protein [Verrucomicrobium sp. BvORR106]